MQPYIFPYIGYFQLMSLVNKFIFLDDVMFINRGWINRNKILLNGNSHLFTIPLENASQNRKINEIKIVDGYCPGKLLKTVELTYKKAPYFNDTYQLINNVLAPPFTNIATLSKKSIYAVSSYLGLTVSFTDSASLFNNESLHGEDRIIDINRQLKTEDYINLIGGRELYNKNNFHQNGINLGFIKVKEVAYRQFKNPFVPNLSIIDVMMFNDKETISQFLQQYELID